MNNKKIFLRIIFIIIIILTGSMGINYILNPYGIFGKYKNYNVSTPINERYLKTGYILENPEKYDSFIFGSSRVGTLEGEKLNKVGKFYNMTFSAALPYEMLSILKKIEKKGIKIKNIILGIDDFDFYTDPSFKEEILYKISYKKLKENKLNFFKYYLLKNPLNKINYTYLFSKEKDFHDILETGKWKKEYADIEIEKNIKKHRENLSNIKINSSNGDRITETIFEIESIIKLCKKNNINLVVIYLPRYINSYNANKEIIEKSKIELQKITNYWDFVKLDGYTNDEYYWYEESHYRPILGRMILKRIFGENFRDDIEIPNNFGEYKEKL